MIETPSDPKDDEESRQGRTLDFVKSVKSGVREWLEFTQLRIPERLADILAEWLTTQILGEPHSLGRWERECQRRVRESRSIGHERLQGAYRWARSQQHSRGSFQMMLSSGELIRRALHSTGSLLEILPYFSQLSIWRKRRLGGASDLPNLPTEQWLSEARQLLCDLPPQFGLNQRMAGLFLEWVEDAFPDWVTNREKAASEVADREVLHLLDYMGATDWRDLEIKLIEAFAHFSLHRDGEYDEAEARNFARLVVLFARLSGLGSHDRSARVRKSPDSRGEVVPYAVHMMRIAVAFLGFVHDFNPLPQVHAYNQIFREELDKLPPLFGLKELIALLRTRERYAKEKMEADKPPEERIPQRMLKMGWLLVWLHDHLEDVNGFELSYDEETGKLLCSAPFDWPHIKECIVPTENLNPTEYTEQFPEGWIKPDEEWINEHTNIDNRRLEIKIPMSQEDYKIFSTLMAAITEPKMPYRELRELRELREIQQEDSAKDNSDTSPADSTYTPDEIQQIIEKVEAATDHPTVRRVLSQIQKSLQGAKKSDGDALSPDEKEGTIDEIRRKYEQDALKIVHFEIVTGRLLRQLNDPMDAVFINIGYLIKIQDREESARLPVRSSPLNGVLDKLIYKRMEQVLIDSWTRSMQRYLTVSEGLIDETAAQLRTLMGYFRGREAAQDSPLSKLLSLLGASPEEIYRPMLDYLARLAAIGRSPALVVPIGGAHPWLGNAVFRELLLYDTAKNNASHVEAAYARWQQRDPAMDLEKRCQDAADVYAWTRRQMLGAEPADMTDPTAICEALQANYLDLVALCQCAKASDKPRIQTQIEAGLKCLLDFAAYMLPDDIDAITEQVQFQSELEAQARLLQKKYSRKGSRHGRKNSLAD